MDATSHLNESPEEIYEHGFLGPLYPPEEYAEKERQKRGFISLYRMQQYADVLYPEDVTLATWTMRALLQDSLFFRLRYPDQQAAGRPYLLDIRHIVTGQTRQEWLAANPESDLDDLRRSTIWMIGVESLRDEYYKLYVHKQDERGINVCQDKHRHKNTVQPFGYMGELALIDPDVLDQQANEQGLNPCIYSFIQGFVLIFCR